MAKSGRKAFAGMAPEGYRIRMMEPGEAPALLLVERAATGLLVEHGRHELAARPPVSMDDFVRFLLRNEVFVAVHRESGAPVGFAAARGLDELYWLSELAVSPWHGRRGVGAALLAAVTARARWFFHRALGLSTYADIPFNAPFYERRGFVRVPRKDLPAILEQRLVDETPEGAETGERTIMVRWL